CPPGNAGPEKENVQGIRRSDFPRRPIPNVGVGTMSGSTEAKDAAAPDRYLHHQRIKFDMRCSMRRKGICSCIVPMECKL
ncbi:hypothetical protein P3T43_007167, partial [Paraburkholderia sp. GAS41]|uniref:hypothetical protein n=1 Tax=Paraburkholderia sp. GAS41 TaxID=3035134 RepID=UPI003D20FF0C